nr:reverse transcriptase domain-containing protein [Tanacetum cinerariifolium]GEZ54935.1 reverse transcriptase domain-containing protein [Tanacetum cinerariifolium]
ILRSRSDLLSRSCKDEDDPRLDPDLENLAYNFRSENYIEIDDERSGTSRYSESRTMSTKEYERRHRSRRSCSPRPSVFSRIKRYRSRSPRQNSKEREDACLKGWVTKERVCPHAQTAATNTPTQGIQKHPQKVKIAEAGIGNQDQRKGSQAGRRMTYLSHGDIKGAPECMRIFRFMHGITNPKLIKRLYDKIPKTVDEMMRVTTSFLRGEVAASNHERKKWFPPWKQQEETNRRNAQGRKVVALNKSAQTKQWKGTTQGGKERRNLREGQSISHPNGLTLGKMARQKITQSFFPNAKILFPPLNEEEGTEGPMIIEAEIRGRCIHRMYMNGESASEILYEQCFNCLCPEIKIQLVPATTPLFGFSGEIIWPIKQIPLLVRIGDEEHSASAWINFVVVRSRYPYNGIIGIPRVEKLQAVP